MGVERKHNTELAAKVLTSHPTPVVDGRTDDARVPSGRGAVLKPPVIKHSHEAWV